MRNRGLARMCRWLLGAVFIFSGLIKLNDAWGTTQTVANYLTLIWLHCQTLNAIVAILWSAFEFSLGCMLILNLWRRLVGWTTLAVMSFFTILTLFVAIFNPVDDCGCFGEAVRMSNWASFVKNIVLWTSAFILWKNVKGIEKVSSNLRSFIVGFGLFLLGMMFGFYTFWTTPLVDFFPFNVGTNLRTDVICTACMNSDTRLIYRNLATGEEQEFTLSDTTWYDDTKWAYISTKTAYDKLTLKDYERDFAIYDADRNMAPQIIDNKGTTVLLVMRKPLPSHYYLENGILTWGFDYYYHNVIVLTEKGVDFGIPTYTMDKKVLNMLLRTDLGVVIVRDGVIIDKRSLH